MDVWLGRYKESQAAAMLPPWEDIRPQASMWSRFLYRGKRLECVERSAYALIQGEQWIICVGSRISGVTRFCDPASGLPFICKVSWTRFTDSQPIHSRFTQPRSQILAESQPWFTKILGKMEWRPPFYLDNMEWVTPLRRWKWCIAMEVLVETRPLDD